MLVLLPEADLGAAATPLDPMPRHREDEQAIWKMSRLFGGNSSCRDDDDRCAEWAAAGEQHYEKISGKCIPPSG